MTTDEKNRRIAEASGWEPHIGGWYAPLGQEQAIYKKPPNYFTDLNAMHEAVSVLTDAQYDDPYTGFTHHLTITTGQDSNRAFRFRLMQEATAAQRAEAFGLTLGLWKEGGVNTRTKLVETIRWSDVRRVKPEPCETYMVGDETWKTGVAFFGAGRWRFVTGEAFSFRVRYFAEWPKGPKGGRK